MNRTRKYLANQIHFLEDTVKTALHLMTIKEYYIADADYYFGKGIIDFKNYLFIETDPRGLYDSNKCMYYEAEEVAKKKYLKNLNIIKNSKNYVTNYQKSMNDTNQIVVLELPKDIIKLFLRGEYSKMYTEEEVHNMYPLYKGESPYLKNLTQQNIEIRGILTKNSHFSTHLKTVVLEKYGVVLEDVEDRELDLPAHLELEKEVLNYTEDFPAFVDLKNFLN